MSHTIDTIREEIGDFTAVMDAGYSRQYQATFSVWVDGECVHTEDRTFETYGGLFIAWKQFVADVANDVIVL